MSIHAEFLSPDIKHVDASRGSRARIRSCMFMYDVYVRCMFNVWAGWGGYVCVCALRFE